MSSSVRLNQTPKLFKYHPFVKASAIGLFAGVITLAVSTSASAALLTSVKEGGTSGLAGNGIYAAPDATLAGILDVQDVDGFSFSSSLNSVFKLCFSVTETSLGLFDTHVRREANNNEQEGDAFLSRGTYNRSGFVSGGPGHDQAIDEEALGLLPGDEVDGASEGDFDRDPIYYTQAGDSDIFFQAIANTFASTTALGLSAGDDVNAVVVWDDNGNGEFDGSDQILFSLAQGSAALTSNPTWSAADVFSINAGGSASLFASHTDLGLEFNDDIDALELVPDRPKTPEPLTTLGTLAAGMMGLLLRRQTRQRRKA